MRMKIEINVDYDEATVGDIDELRDGLEAEVSSAIHRGMLTPSMEEVVDGFELVLSVPSLEGPLS